MTEGKKFDAEKVMLDLVDYKFVEGGAWILTYGAVKYERNNWKNFKPEDRHRFIAALLRHAHAYADGELTDPESGLSHLYHIFCEAMFLDYFDRKASPPDIENFKKVLAAIRASKTKEDMSSKIVEELRLDH